MVERHPKPVGEVWKVEINGKKFKLGGSLHKELEEKIKEILSKNMDVFAWSATDRLHIDLDFLCHHLTIPEGLEPVVQRRQKFNKEKRLAMKKETQNLREIQYPEWLENVVMVKKSNRKWRMCVDFIDLNNVCPKDSYPLPNINSFVEWIV